MWVRSIQRNEKLCGFEYILGLISSHTCHGNFSKHSQYFLKVSGCKDMAIYYSSLSESSQNIRNVLKSSRDIRDWKGGLTCISSYISFNSVESIAPTRAEIRVVLKIILEKQPELVSREVIFTSLQISNGMFWNKNAILGFWENFRIVSSMNILGGANVDINCKHLKHGQRRVQLFPIISLREFPKFKLDFPENVSMKFWENFATAATCHYLPLRVPA